MADNDDSTSSTEDSASGVTINMSDYPTIATALQFSSSDQMLASLGVSPSSSDDTATA